MKRAIRWYDYITINIYWFALTTRSQVLAPLIIPLLVQQFVGEAVKGTYVGQIRLWALMTAVLVQSLMGIISDQSRSKWGRRRPFILIGTIGEVIAFVAVGFIAGLDGLTGYWLLFAIYIFSMVSSNTAQAATQGLIPDLVPDEKKGRFSGVKALLELPVPVIFVSFVIGKLVSAGKVWEALFALIAVMIIATVIAMFIPETPFTEEKKKLDWQPFIRLVVMTAVFTVTILGVGALVKFLIALNASTTSPGFFIPGLIGVIGMAVAVAFGVWASIYVGTGKSSSEQPDFVLWVINRLAFLVGSTNIASFMIYFLQERFADMAGEKAAGPASRIIMFVGIFILLSALPSGWLTDKFGKKPLIILSAVLAAVGTFIAIAVPNLTVISIGGCFIGAAIGLFYASNWALGTDIVKKEQAGQFLGVSNLAGAGAGAIGAYIGGPIADSAGYVLLMSIYGVLFIASIIPVIFIKEKRA